MRVKSDLFDLVSRKIEGTFLYFWTVFRGVRPQRKRPHGLPGRLVVSLTSYPKRYRTLAATLISILNQSVQADEVVLWIAHDQMASLPKAVLALRDKGLRIAACEDLRSYKKIVPALIEDPDRFIVTADDDVFYEPGWLETLVMGYSGEKLVIAHRVHRIVVADDGKPGPYLSWKLNFDAQVPSSLNFATGIGGVLYPPGSLHPDVLDQTGFLECCPHGDDIWLYWMVRRNGWEVASAGPPRLFMTWPGSQLIGLHRINTTPADNMNDRQITAMIEHYGWPN